jgi:hypothetical protein
MKVHAFGVFLLVSALTVFAGRVAAQPAKDSDEELAKKIQRLRDQLDPLIQERKNRTNKLLEQQRTEAERKAREEAERKAKEDAAKKKAEAERKAKEDAEKKKHVVKVEIRGLMGKGPEAVFNGYGQGWFVTIGNMKWRLDFGDKKELTEQAAKLAGKPIVITGTVKAPQQFNPYQFPPNLNPYPGFPQPGMPQPFPQPYQNILYQVPYFPPPITISVESLKEAKD